MFFWTYTYSDGYINRDTVLNSNRNGYIHSDTNPNSDGNRNLDTNPKSDTSGAIPQPLDQDASSDR